MNLVRYIHKQQTDQPALKAPAVAPLSSVQGQPANQTALKVPAAAHGSAAIRSTDAQQNNAQKLRLAIIMTGRLSSLSFNSTGFGLVRPNTRAGHHVDIFTSLSNGGFNCNSSWGKAFAQPPVDWPTIKADFGRIIWQSGGRLVRMQIRKQIKIHEFDEEDRFFQWKKKKMKSQKCAVYQQHFNKSVASGAFSLLTSDRKPQQLTDAEFSGTMDFD